MTSTVFVNGVTLTDDDWFNDTNSVVYDCLGPSKITNVLAADVNMTNIANYFTGPTIAQGSTGTWFVSGYVTLRDENGDAVYYVRLWDGTTVIASTAVKSFGATIAVTATLSGYIASPAGNLRIDVRDITSTNGNILANQSGLTKDSVISAFRIA